MMTQTILSQHRKWLYDELDVAKKLGVLDLYLDIPNFIKENLNPYFELRPYQREAFARFFYYYNQYPDKECPLHVLFNMATGSGKTLIMAGLILYLYEKGYRNFLFFVNSTNIIEKTKDNFLNTFSIKYLFNSNIYINNKKININNVFNFEGINKEDINICFTTIQKLHSDLYVEKENSLTFEDFRNKKVVLIADEAHHGQSKTKQKTLFKSDEKPNWENTVEYILKQNKENILLEFTATMDFMNKAIEDKYKLKLIYKYDLKQFRSDKFSKDVEILRSDTDKKGRTLLALLLNQHRQDVASKHGIHLKPVILFKAQKTIEQSEENKVFFHNLIHKLSTKDLEEIKKKTDIKEIKRAFEFYNKEKITTELLVQKLKINFSKNKCISMNNKDSLKKNQILVNSLEKKKNQIRVIFTVNKLNEGWDVLNLFDIVRLYDGQAGGGGYGNKIAPSTMSEAQLIGRGARYFPFNVNGKEGFKFLRKYDDDLDNELRILEELHFHSPNEHRYISDLKRALVNEGIMDDTTVEKELKLKDNFKKTCFFKNGQIYLNQRIQNNYSNVKSVEDLGISRKDYSYNVRTFKGKVTKALTDDAYDNLYIAKESATLQVNQIEKHIFLNAISRKDFFKFDNIKKIFPKINSINELFENKEYFSNIKINFTGSAEDIYNLSNDHKFKALSNILDDFEDIFKNHVADYVGSKIFYPYMVQNIFNDKILKVEIGSEREDGQEAFVQKKEWYAFNANYGTSEEKACVEFIDRLIKENFNVNYKDIFLLRNELHFVIYNFSDGRPFAPDFVLFMKAKDGTDLTYQIFIEPKGKFLEKTDEWKEDFLINVRKTFESSGLTKFVETNKYCIFGVPFFNQVDENKFNDSILRELGV